MSQTLRLESEFVLIVPDLYVGAAEPPRALPLPALSSMARFGSTERLPRGWRAWLAGWLGRPDLAAASPAPVAAVVAARRVDVRGYLWLADPVHLVAGLTGVYLAPRGLLSLDPAAQAELGETFERTFAELGYRLVPLRGGGFLAEGPVPAGEPRTTEPARALGASIAESMPSGPGAAALLALGAEIEMWLHDHPLNARRQREGLPPITTLWLWGGGPPLGTGAREETSPRDSLAAAVFSDDAYVEGLAQLSAARFAPSARDLASVLAARAPRRLVTVELAGQAAEALERLDRDWIGPALERLRSREIARLVLIANDRRISLAPRDRLKRWRRRRSAWEVLE